MLNRDVLLDFKQLRVSKEDLITKIGKEAFRQSVVDPVQFTAKDIIHLLNEFKQGNVSMSELLDWINTI